MNTAEQVQTLATRLLALHWRMATAESCTGGMIAAACTDLAGSSAWFERGVVSYSNEAKAELLRLPVELINAHGAVSEAVALAMAQGACQVAPVQAAVAVTGIAGPTGGSPTKPVGTVWVAWCIDGRTDAQGFCFPGDRQQVRQATVDAALAGLLARLPQA